MDQTQLDADFHELIDVEELDRDLYRSRTHETAIGPVLFGGEVLAQSLMSASRSVEEARTCHSLHAYFLRPGDGHIPVIYQVERTRDGGAFSTRRVTARQKGVPIFHMECSFHHVEPAMLEHQFDMPQDIPDPDSLRSLREIAAGMTGKLEAQFGARLAAFRHIDVKPLDAAAWMGGHESLTGRRCWVKLAPTINDDPVMAQCGLAYLSDYWLAAAAAAGQPYNDVFSVARVASIDHSMWFHRPTRPDAWMLYDTDSPSAQGARGLARGQLFDRSGALAASTVQEALFRAKR